MPTYRYRTTCWGDLYEVSANWAEASSEISGLPGRQVADFRHSPHAALRRVLELEASASGAGPFDDLPEEVVEEIDDAMERAVEA